MRRSDRGRDEIRLDQRWNFGLAVFSIFVQPGDAPATASDIRTLVAELERGGRRDP